MRRGLLRRACPPPSHGAPVSRPGVRRRGRGWVRRCCAPPRRVSRVSATPASPTLRVVAVTYSPGEALEGFVSSLARATTRPVEVVLADNGSTDGAPERAAAEHPNVRLLRTGGNVGYGAAGEAGVGRPADGDALGAHPHRPLQPPAG